MKMPIAFARLQERWKIFSPREQQLVRIATLMLGLVAVWWLLVAPPLRTFTHSQSELKMLEGQRQKMLGLQRQVATLQGLPKMTRNDSLRALDTTVKQRLGTSAQLSVLGENATLTLRSTPANALAQWLAQARIDAHAIPIEARLMRDSTSVQGQALWSGTISIRLPSQ